MKVDNEIYGRAFKVLQGIILTAIFCFITYQIGNKLTILNGDKDSFIAYLLVGVIITGLLLLTLYGIIRGIVTLIFYILDEYYAHGELNEFFESVWNFFPNKINEFMEKVKVNEKDEK